MSKIVRIFNEEDRKKMEALGQMSIFDVLNSKQNLEENDSEAIEAVLYSLDTFEGDGYAITNQYIGFDTKKKETDPDFIIVVDKEDFDSLNDFKESFNIDLAFAQKEDTDNEKVVSLYEKRKKLDKAKKNSIKEADKEAKEIKELENSGYESDDIPSAEPIKKRSRKPKN